MARSLLERCSDQLKQRVAEVIRDDDLDEPGKAAVLSQLIRADVADDAARLAEEAARRQAMDAPPCKRPQCGDAGGPETVDAVLQRVINKVIASSDEGLAEAANRALISCSKYVVRCGGAVDALAGARGEARALGVGRA